MSQQSKPKTRCPICNKPSVFEFRPFCSQRCKEVDLGRWLKGVYVVPGSQPGRSRFGDDED